MNSTSSADFNKERFHQCEQSFVTWRTFCKKYFRLGGNKSFQNKTSFLARLVHPNIVPSFCYTTNNHICSIVMEWMHKELHDLMLKKPHELSPFELFETIIIMLQIMEGVKDTKMHKNKG
jgi:serine/threonine protein kinase